MVVRSLRLEDTDFIVSGEEFRWIKYPTPIPRTIATKIYRVSFPEELPFIS
jgi:hypothetical protein